MSEVKNEKQEQVEENKKVVNPKPKNFFTPKFGGGKNNGFMNQRNSFKKAIRNNHRPQG